MRKCATCKFRWIKPGKFIDWYCRIPGKPLVRIGMEAELKAKKGCDKWEK